MSIQGNTTPFRPASASAESDDPGKPPRTILFTSGTANEGKTVTALNTAMVLAQMDARVLVIDADMRRPNCHELLKSTRNGLGLTEVLAGQCEASQAIRSTSTPLFFISSGKTPPNPAELLASERMKEVLADLRERYEYIVIDAPPCVADT